MRSQFAAHFSPVSIYRDFEQPFAARNCFELQSDLINLDRDSLTEQIVYKQNNYHSLLPYLWSRKTWLSNEATLFTHAL